MTACPRCIARGKTWKGDAPKCAFEGGRFSGDNWNCATAAAIREAIGHDGLGRMHQSASAPAYSQDTTAVLVPIDLNVPGQFLLVSWYKRRGRTAVIATVGSEGVIPLALRDVEQVIAHLERMLLGVVPTPPEARS